MNETIWYENVSEFITLTNYFMVLPKDGMTLEGKLNAICRFFIFAGVFLTLVRNEYRYLFLGICALGLSVIIYEFDKGKTTVIREKLAEENAVIMDNKICTRPTATNPFMNPSVYDYGKADKREACDVTHPGVNRTVNNLFNAKVYRNASDIFNKEASQREFYTVPSTTIPNKQGEFAEWLYGKGRTCKEGNGSQCPF